MSGQHSAGFYYNLLQNNDYTEENFYNINFCRGLPVFKGHCLTPVSLSVMFFNISYRN